jgi:hypothetical protein
LSRIFDWYGKDFERGRRSFLGFAGFTNLPDIAASYAEQLADSEADRARLHARAVTVRLLDYDWSLNDAL